LLPQPHLLRVQPEAQFFLQTLATTRWSVTCRVTSSSRDGMSGRRCPRSRPHLLTVGLRICTTTDRRKWLRYQRPEPFRRRRC
jgi:hypothetical protein